MQTWPQVQTAGAGGWHSCDLPARSESWLLRCNVYSPPILETKPIIGSGKVQASSRSSVTRHCFMCSEYSWAYLESCSLGLSENQARAAEDGGREHRALSLNEGGGSYRKQGLSSCNAWLPESQGERMTGARAPHIPISARVPFQAMPAGRPVCRSFDIEHT